MQGVVSHGTQPCKRDALPTELSARTPDFRAFSDLPPLVNGPSNGTERKLAGAREQQSPEIVPKRPGEFTVEEMREAYDALDFGARPFTYPALKAPKGHIVYFVGGEVGPVNIGFTQQPIKARLVCIQNGSPIKLHVLATQPAPRAREKFYHRLFAAHRLHGEWFDRCPAIQAEIERLTKAALR